MHCEESVIHDEVFEVSLTVHLVRKNGVVESGIRDGIFRFVRCLVRFLLGVEKFRDSLLKEIVEFRNPGALFLAIRTALSP